MRWRLVSLVEWPVSKLLTSVAHAADGLRRETDLFAQHGPQVLLWVARAPGIVCPRTYEHKDGFVAASRACSERGWPVHLRRTGGGAVPQGPGVLNLALAFDAPPGFTIEDGYRNLTQVIREGLGAAGAELRPGATPGSFCDGAWNLSQDGQKIVGTAQRWRSVRGGRQRLLTHALILVDDDFQTGTDAVALFHEVLGLAPVLRDVHTSLKARFDLTEVPLARLHAAAHDMLCALRDT